MAGVRRLVDFVFVCLTAAVIWMVAARLWPVFGLVAPVGALIASLFVANLVDGVWFAIRRRAAGAPLAAHAAVDTRTAGPSAAA